MEDLLALKTQFLEKGKVLYEEHITVKPQVDVAPAEAPVKELSLNDVPVHNNEEISINYIHEGKI